jgi:tetraacyldisaccharide 4'-kinase
MGLNLDRRMTCAENLPWPTISVGNIALGGRSKTPMVISLTRRLQKRGFEVIVLSRGYGRTSNAACVLKPGLEKFSVAECGDEPAEIFLRTGVHVLIGAARLQNVKNFAAKNRNPSARRVILLDDGFQHWAINRDIDIVLVRKEDYFDRLLPAGSLRETPEALKRASHIFEEGVDFQKVISFSSPSSWQPSSLGVLTTRAPASRSLDAIAEHYPNSRVHVMDLPDHARKTEMLRALENYTGSHIVLGWKEAVKLFEPEELRSLPPDGILKLTTSKKVFEVTISEVDIRWMTKTAEGCLESAVEKICALKR